MPEPPHPRPHLHPAVRAKRPAFAIVSPRAFATPESFAELAVTSNFTFLTGASHPEELVERAAELGYRAIAVTDKNTLAGIVRAHVAALEAGIGLVVGARLELRIKEPGGHTPLSVLVHVTSRSAYGRLSRLLTLGKRRAPKGECDLGLEDLCAQAEGIYAALVPQPTDLGRSTEEAALPRLREAFGDRLSIAAALPYGSDDAGWLKRLAALSKASGVPLVATNDVHYHAPERRPLQDVVTCIRHGCSLDEAGYRLFANAERHLKTPAEMARLFAAHSAAIERAAHIAEQALAFSLDELEYQYPSEICPDGTTPQERLAELTWIGAEERYPNGVPPEVHARLERELVLIAELAYAPYFLTVHDLVVFARSRDILCQGRGAAANSAVCYVLGITAVDPDRIDLLFERFVSKERDEPPDIDIDFEHERREEVIQYLYTKYGRERAALTAEVITYRGRSAVRDVGKTLGLSLDCVDRLAKDLDWWSDGMGDPDRIRELGLDPEDATMKQLVALVGEILGFPRHLSQHVGGFVITEGPLVELVPVENAAMENRTVIEWDKDDIDAMGMLKIDVLGLGMLTCVRKCFELINARAGGRSPDGRPLALHTVPAEDPAVYDMICKADTVGVFQIESRAQMSMLPRLRPRCFYDLVIEVAIVRPGPIQGDMVHPYLRRRRGEEQVSYPKPEVRRVLEKTLGVPLFQEQAMALAIVAAGFTGGEADGLRRAMAAWKRKGRAMERYGAKLIRGMLERGYPREFAERCFKQMQGFSEYGFPESHAASFALIVYTSSWLKCHYPAAFAAALINSQPMGFYAPAQIVRDAEQHGVEVRPVDVNESAWDCTLETGRRGDVLRLGLRLVKGLGEDPGHAIAEIVARHGRFRTMQALHRASGVSVAALKKLARADAFQSMKLDRQAALWEAKALAKERLPMFDELEEEPPSAPALPPFSAEEQVLHDYATLHLSLKAHPLSFLREQLAAMGVSPAHDLARPKDFPSGRWTRVAGIVLVRQRPATASGIVFMTLEDETGIANLVIRPPVFARYRSVAKHARIVLAHGPVERDGEVVHLIARKLEAVSDAVGSLDLRSRDFH